MRIPHAKQDIVLRDEQGVKVGRSTRESGKDGGLARRGRDTKDSVRTGLTEFQIEVEHIAGLRVRSSMRCSQWPNQLGMKGFLCRKTDWLESLRVQLLEVTGISLSVQGANALGCSPARS